MGEKKDKNIKNIWLPLKIGKSILKSYLKITMIMLMQICHSKTKLQTSAEKVLECYVNFGGYHQK